MRIWEELGRKGRIWDSRDGFGNSGLDLGSSRHVFGVSRCGSGVPDSVFLLLWCPKLPREGFGVSRGGFEDSKGGFEGSRVEFRGLRG